MNKAARVAVAAILIAALFGGIGALLDRTESAITLTVIGLGLLLAWYSILDLREQRKERFWPHTIDRLVRATFVAVTLVFAVHLALPKPEKAQPRPQAISDPAAPKSTPSFGEAVYALAQSGRWDDKALNDLVRLHFQDLSAEDSRVQMTLPNGCTFVLGADAKGPIHGRVVK